MRPTSLGFRSPKERTPGPNYPQMSRHGGSFIWDRPCFLKAECSFGNESRFLFLDRDAKPQTGLVVGPGSYNNDQASIAQAHISGGTKWHRFHHQPNPEEHKEYIFIGDSLVRDPALEPSYMASFNSSVPVIHTGSAI